MIFIYVYIYIYIILLVFVEQKIFTIGLNCMKTVEIVFKIRAILMYKYAGQLPGSGGTSKGGP